LTVVTPGIIGDSVEVKVAVAGSEFWSNAEGFKFKDLPETHDLVTVDEEIAWPNGVAVDANDNVYIGSAGDEVIYMITPDGDKSEFASVPVNGAIHFGPSGYLYVCEQGEGKIQRISPDGGTVEDVVEATDPIDFDWDADQNMYIVSNWSGISKYDGSSVTELVSLDNPKCIRIYEDMLYISDIWNSTIWRYDITADGLENQEAVYEGDSPSSFDIASNGLMIFAEAWEISLYTMFEDGSLGPAMYADEMETPMRYMLWNNKTIYVVFPGWGDVGKTLKAYIGLDQAPRYGKQ
jgi:sugar lactone lactonase YvrE